MNLTYFGYNVLKTDYRKLFNYITKCSKLTKMSKWTIIKDILYCFFRYDTRFIDYFYFRFFDFNVNRIIHVSVWDMYKFHKKFNSLNSIILRDKVRFREFYKEHSNYPFFVLKKDNMNDLSEWILKLKSNKIVCKNPFGTTGEGVLILSWKVKDNQLYIEDELASKKLKNLYEMGFSLFEAFINQHIVMQNLNPLSVNTIRIVTFLTKDGEVEIWGALLRIGNNKNVDNFDAGGISAPVDIKTGKVCTPGIKKDPFDNSNYYYHPITNEPIMNLVIPFWDNVIEMTKSIALLNKDIRTVGWDVAITAEGPVFIEGNDNWDKTHFELVSGIGLKEKIQNLLKENQHS